MLRRSVFVIEKKSSAPDTRSADIDLKTMLALRGYRLKPASPCVDAGVHVKGRGPRDILGTPIISGKADVGAVESPSK